MKVLVIIPTYNERDNIPGLLEEIYGVRKNIDVLIVDDNSPDGTYKVVADLKNSQYRENLHLLRRERKKGLGSAYLAGFKWALERDYESIFEMDADFSHDPDYIPRLLAKLQECDLVLGSRYVKGGSVRGWGPIRKIISRGGSLYARMILGLPFKDLTGGV